MGGLGEYVIYHMFRFLKPRLHDTTCCQSGCQTGCQNGLTTTLTAGWMFVYTIQSVVKPVVQPVSQLAVSCKRGFRAEPVTEIETDIAMFQTRAQQ